MMTYIPRSFRTTAQDRMNWDSRSIGDQQLHLVLKFDRPLDMKVLERAVRLSLDAEPVLGCEFVEKEYFAYWRRRRGLDEDVLVTIADGVDQEAALMGFLTTACDPTRYPLVATALFHGPEECLCIKVNHAVSDAAGVRDYGYLLASIYTHLAEDMGYSPRINEEEDRGMTQIWRRFPAKKQIEFVRSGLSRSFAKRAPGKRWVIAGASWGTGERTMLIRTLDRTDYRAIEAYCERKDATFNDVISTAFLRALFERIRSTEGVPLPLQVTVDLRRYLPSGGNGSIANLSSSLLLEMPRKEGQGFDETLSEVKQKMDMLKGSDLAVANIFFIGVKYRLTSLSKGRREILAAAHESAKKGVALPMLSNIGILDAERLRFGDLRPTGAYITTPIAYSPAMILGASSYDDRLTFTLGCCRLGLPDSFADRLLDSLLEEIVEGTRAT